MKVILIGDRTGGSRDLLRVVREYLPNRCRLQTRAATARSSAITALGEQLGAANCSLVLAGDTMSWHGMCHAADSEAVSLRSGMKRSTDDVPSDSLDSFPCRFCKDLNHGEGATAPHRRWRGYPMRPTLCLGTRVHRRELRYAGDRGGSDADPRRDGRRCCLRPALSRPATSLRRHSRGRAHRVHELPPHTFDVVPSRGGRRVPGRAAVSDTYRDLDASFSPDGSRLCSRAAPDGPSSARYKQRVHAARATRWRRLV